MTVEKCQEKYTSTAEESRQEFGVQKVCYTNG